MVRKLMVFSLFAFFLVAVEHCWPQSQAPRENVIYTEVVGMRNTKGQVFCAIYSSADGFPKESQRSIHRASSSISDKKASCEFLGIGPGMYAVSVFHDENSNRKPDTNLLGVPSEGVGASNDGRSHMGPPTFDVAAFQFAEGRVSLKIIIHYL